MGLAPRSVGTVNLAAFLSALATPEKGPGRTQGCWDVVPGQGPISHLTGLGVSSAEPEERRPC